MPASEIRNWVKSYLTCLGARDRNECNDRSSRVEKIDPELFCEWATTRRSSEIRRQRLGEAFATHGDLFKDVAEGLEKIIDTVEKDLPPLCKLSIRG